MDQLDLEQKYVRWGRLDYGRLCDKLANLALHLQPGNVLPARWRMGDPAEFVNMYGDGYLWSQTQNYQMLIHDGVPQFRIWTRSKNTVWVDISDSIADVLPITDSIQNIPSGNLMKCKPFTKRIKVTGYAKMTNIVVCAQYLCERRG